MDLAASDPTCTVHGCLSYATSPAMELIHQCIVLWLDLQEIVLATVDSEEGNGVATVTLSLILGLKMMLIVYGLS